MQPVPSKNVTGFVAGREHGRVAVEMYTERKSVCILI